MYHQNKVPSLHYLETSFQRAAIKEEQLSFQFYPWGASKAAPRWTYFMYLHGKALSSLLREQFSPPAGISEFNHLLLVRGWPLCLTAFSPAHRGIGLPGVESHWCDPFPDVGWRFGIYPLAHAGEVSQQEELTWNWVSLASPGTALGSSKANSNLWQWLRTNLLFHSCFKSNGLEALLLDRWFAQLLYMCADECLGGTSLLSFLLSFLSPVSPGLLGIDG